MKSSAPEGRTAEDPPFGLASPGDRPHAIPVALALVLAAAMIWLTLLKGDDGRFVFIPFYPAVMLALVYGGVRAGAAATLASALVIGYILLAPVGNVSAQSMNGLALAFFVGANLLVLVIAARFQRGQTRRQERALQRAHDQGSAEALGRQTVERRRAEAELTQATAILRGIGQNSPDPIFAKDVEGRFLYANPAVLAIIGKSSGEVLGRTDAELHDNAAQAAEVMDNDRRIMRSGVFEVIEERWDVAGQGVRIFHAAKAPLRLDDGTLAGIVGVCADITERNAVEVELRMAKAEAERALLARSKFLAAASHDLRQPVQSLVLLLAVLKQHAQTPQVVKAADMMGLALEGLTLLLNGILDMSRFDAGVVAPQLQRVDLRELVGRLAQEYAMSAQSKGLKLRTSLRPVAVRTDPALLERALRNLIENALRFTMRGGVLIGLRRRGDRVRIDVFDTGVGVAADKSTHIFQEFYQVGNPGRDRAKGLGLGLSIVERIARLLGAEIAFRSHDGRGSRFSIFVPADEAPVSAMAAPEIIGVACGRILIIDDEQSVRAGLQLLLEGWGYQTVAAASGEEALELGAREGWRFDAIVADHRLGAGLSGAKTVNEIHARSGRTFPTIVITGDTSPDRIADIHASGYVMLHKPVAANELRRTLVSLLSRDDRPSQSA